MMRFEECSILGLLVTSLRKLHVFPFVFGDVWARAKKGSTSLTTDFEGAGPKNGAMLKNRGGIANGGSKKLQDGIVNSDICSEILNTYYKILKIRQRRPLPLFHIYTVISFSKHLVSSIKHGVGTLCKVSTKMR